MNDASESSFVTCVKLVELDYERAVKNRALMKKIEPLTPADRAVLFADRSIRSVAPGIPVRPAKPTGTCTHENCTNASRPGFKLCAHHAEAMRQKNERFRNSRAQ